MNTLNIAVNKIIAVGHIYNQLIECDDVSKVYITSDVTLHIFINGQAILNHIYNNPYKYCEVTDLYNDYMNGIDDRCNVARQIFDRMVEFYEVW